MIKFREKDYSVVGDAIKWGGITAAAGGTLTKGSRELSKLSRSKLINGSSTLGRLIDKTANSKVTKFMAGNPGLTTAAAFLVGSSLALAAHLLKGTNTAINKKSLSLFNNQNYNVKRIALLLSNMGYKSNIDFTLDPAEADYLKTKVCFVIKRSQDNINLIINMTDDPKLEKISRSIIKNLPTSTKISKKEYEEGNELLLTVLSSNSGSSEYVASVVEKFIQKGFPVFLSEIN